MKIQVTDWYKWTRFKKRLTLFLFIVGVGLGLGTEDSGSMAFGFLGLVMVMWAGFLINSIREDEW